MKKHILFAGAVLLATTAAIAKTIDFDTVINWNSEVIAAALDNSGFIGSSNAAWDVRVTHQRILDELVKKQSFSLRDATRVCLDKCNMSDFLKNGRGQSGKKCPELCTGFADALVKENNSHVDVNVLKPDTQDSSMRKLQDMPAKACRRLAQQAEKSGLSLPMLCGGMCHRFGNDTVIITDNEKTIEYKIDDFCDDSKKNREYYYVVSANGELDVSGYSTDGKLYKLKEAQTQPIADYKSEQSRKEKEKREAELQKRGMPYTKRVEQNGYCHYQEIGGYSSVNVDCKREVRKYAQANACKIRKYTEIWAYDTLSVNPNKPAHRSGCVISGDFEGWSGDSYEYKIINYEYTPSYKDCVATFDESRCDSAAEGYEIMY